MDQCGELREVDGLNALQKLDLEDQAMETLPEWLLLEGGELRFSELQGLDMKSNADLLSRCVVDGPEWHEIRNIPRVMGYSPSISTYFTYIKAPYMFFGNLAHNAAHNGGGNSGQGSSGSSSGNAVQ